MAMLGMALGLSKEQAEAAAEGVDVFGQRKTESSQAGRASRALRRMSLASGALARRSVRFSEASAHHSEASSSLQTFQKWLGATAGDDEAGGDDVERAPALPQGDMSALPQGDMPAPALPRGDVGALPHGDTRAMPQGDADADADLRIELAL